MLEKLPESVGRVLVNRRAGMGDVVYNRIQAQRDLPRMSVTSPTFAFNGRLPVRYTADGKGVSPPLAWDGCPPDTAAIAIIVEDADAPTPHPLVHLIAIDLAPDDRSIDEGALSAPNEVPPELSVGVNSFFRHAWLPPDPPPGHGEHRYVFQAFALREGAPFSKTAGRKEFIEVILDRATAVGCLIGIYGRDAPEALQEEQSVGAEDSPATA